MAFKEEISRLLDIYSDLWTLRDERVEGWALMSSIKPVLFFLVLYFVMVMNGPRWMKNRQPFNLTSLLFIYNVSLAYMNYYIFKEIIVYSFKNQYNWLCEPVRLSKEPDEMRMIVAGHLYLVSKLLEFLDTMFIIMRKKNNQLSFLHVYHHSTMFLLTWVVIRWVPGGSALLAASVNAFVHVVMYSYYCLSALGPTIAKYLWWKKYITIIQLIQFLWGCSFAINMFFIGCDYTKWMQYVGVFYTLSYLILFGRFYFRTYRGGNRKKPKQLHEDDHLDKRQEKILQSSNLCYRRTVSALAASTSG